MWSMSPSKTGRREWPQDRTRAIIWSSGRVPLHPHHLQPGDHDLPHEGIPELKDTLDELPFLAGYEAPFLAFVNDVLDFTLQVFRLRDDPAGELQAKALEETGVGTVGLFHA